MIPRGAAALRCTGDLRGMRVPQIKGCSMSRGGITAELQPFYYKLMTQRIGSSCPHQVHRSRACKPISADGAWPNLDLARYTSQAAGPPRTNRKEADL